MIMENFRVSYLNGPFNDLFIASSRHCLFIESCITKTILTELNQSNLNVTLQGLILHISFDFELPGSSIAGQSLYWEILDRRTDWQNFVYKLRRAQGLVSLDPYKYKCACQTSLITVELK